MEEPLRNVGRFDRATRVQKVHVMFELVALPPELLTRKPHELSGGLAEIALQSEQAAARQTRDAATRHSQGSYEAFFSVGAVQGNTG